LSTLFPFLLEKNETKNRSWRLRAWPLSGPLTPFITFLKTTNSLRSDKAVFLTELHSFHSPLQMPRKRASCDALINIKAIALIPVCVFNGEVAHCVVKV